MQWIWIGLLALLVFYAVRSFHTAAARASGARQDYQRALTHWEKAYQKKKTPGRGMQYGYLLLRSGDFSRAEQIFSELLERDDLKAADRLQIQVMHGLIIWKKGDLNQAIALYEKLLEQGENTVVYANLGFLYLLRDDPEQVLPFLKKAYAYHDTHPVIMDNLADCYLRMGRLEEAEELLERCVRLPQPIAESFYHYGVLQEQRGNYEDALTYYQKASEMDLNALSGLSRRELEERICRLEQKEEEGES